MRCIAITLLWLLGAALSSAAPTATSTATVRTQFGAQADFFVCYVSRTAGSYTNAYCSTVPQFSISGLTQGATYYFAVSAFYRAKETAKSPEVSKLVPLTSPKLVYAGTR